MIHFRKPIQTKQVVKTLDHETAVKFAFSFNFMKCTTQNHEVKNKCIYIGLYKPSAVNIKKCPDVNEKYFFTKSLRIST